MSEGAAYSVSLANVGGTITLAYYDEATDAGRVTSLADGDCTQLGANFFSASNTRHIRLVSHPSGNPYIAYQDAAGRMNVVTLVGGNWSPVGPSSFSNGVPSDISLAFDSAGLPWVAFVEDGGRAMLMKYDGDSWSYEPSVAGVSASAAQYTSLAFNAVGDPCVAFVDYDASGPLVVCVVGGVLQFMDTTGLSSGAFETRLAFHPTTGDAYLAYVDGSGDYRARLTRWSGASWEFVGDPAFSDSLTSSVNLAFDSSGVPFVAYVAYIRDNYRVRVQKFAPMVVVPPPSFWHAVGPSTLSDGNPGGQYHPISLAVTAAGDPVVGYSNSDNSNGAAAMQFNRMLGSWEMVGSGAASLGSASSPNLAISATGDVALAYYDQDPTVQCGFAKVARGDTWTDMSPNCFASKQANQIRIAYSLNVPYIAFETANPDGYPRLSVVRLEESAWVPVGPPTFSDSSPAYISLALDGAGTPWVAFVEGGNLAMLVTYDELEGSWMYMPSSGVSTSPALFTSLAFNGAGNPCVAFMDYDTYSAAVVCVVGGVLQPMDTAGLPSGGVVQLRLAFHPLTGSAYLAFADLNGFASVMQWTGAAWEYVGNQYISNEQVDSFNLVFDGSTGVPFVAFSGSGNFITVLKYGPETPTTGEASPSPPPPSPDPLVAVWQTLGTATTVGTNPGGDYRPLGLAFDVAGSPVVGFSDDFGAAAARLFDPTTDIWDYLGCSSVTTGAAYSVTLANVAGTMALAYYDEARDAGCASILTAGGCYQLGDSCFSSGSTKHIRLASHPVGVAFVAFQDAAGRLTVAALSAGTWSPVGPSSFSNGVPTDISLAFDSSGTPWVAFVEDGGLAMLMKFGSGSWSYEPSAAGVSTSAAQYTSLAFNAAGDPCVAFFDYDANSPLVVCVVGGVLQYMDATGLSSGAFGTRLAFHPTTGDAYLAYIDAYANSYVRLMRWSGTAWEFVGDPYFSGAGSSSSVNLAFDSTGVPFVAYLNIDNRIAVQKFAPLVEAPTPSPPPPPAPDPLAPIWQTLGAPFFVDANPGGEYRPLGLAFDDFGGLVLGFSEEAFSGAAAAGYYDPASSAWDYLGCVRVSTGVASSVSLANVGGTMTLAYYDQDRDAGCVSSLAAGGCTQLGASCFSTGSTRHISLATNPSGIPYIAYQDASSRLSVVSLVGGDWSHVGPSSFSNGVPSDISLAFDFADIPWVAFVENGGRAKLVKLVGKAWSYEPSIAGVSTSSAQYTSLAFNGAGDPCVAFYEYDGNGSVVTCLVGGVLQPMDTMGLPFSIVEARLAFHPSTGDAYLAFADPSANDFASLMRWSGDAWVYVGGPAFSDVGSYSLNLVFNRGVPYVAYRRSDNGIRVAMFAAPYVRPPTYYQDFRSLGTVSFTDYCPEGQARPVALSVRGGSPVVGFIDAANGNLASAVVYDYNLEGWVPIGGTPASAGEAYFVSVAVNGVSEVALAYYDSAAGVDSGCAKVLSGANWADMGDACFAPLPTSQVRIAYPPNNDGPYIAFGTTGPSIGNDRLNVVRLTGGSWAPVGPANFSIGAPTDVSLAFDATGTPWIAFTEDNVNAMLVKFDSTTDLWQYMPSAVGWQQLSAGVARLPSLAFNGNGEPCVAFCEGMDDNALVVKCLAGEEAMAMEQAGLPQSDIRQVVLGFSPAIGRLHLALYIQDPTTPRITVLSYDGASWASVSSNTDIWVSGGVEGLTLDFSGDGSPFVGYRSFDGTVHIEQLMWILEDPE